MSFNYHHSPSHVSHRSIGWGAGLLWFVWAFLPEEKEKIKVNRLNHSFHYSGRLRVTTGTHSLPLPLSIQIIFTLSSVTSGGAGGLPHGMTNLQSYGI